MYRFHLDIPLGHDLDKARKISEHIVQMIESFVRTNDPTGTPLEDVGTIGIRLDSDEGRVRRNLLEVDSSGHATTKKTQITPGWIKSGM